MLRQRSIRGESPIAADVPLDGAFEDSVIAGFDARRVRSALAGLPHNERSLIEMDISAG